MVRRLTHVIGFDDAPFEPAHRGDVPLIGAVFAGTRLEGVLCDRLRRDDANATRVIAGMVRGCRHCPQLHAVLLQGINFAGFNVVDLAQLHSTLGLSVLVVSRRRPDLAAIRRALLGHVRGGARKWRLIEMADPMEALGGVYIQRAGLTTDEACALLDRFRINSVVPEPLRVAHLIAGALVRGQSTGRA